MSATERAWSAGFFSGEGCTSVSHRKPHDGRCARTQLLMVVTQCGDEAPELLERFRCAVGTGAIAGPFRTTNGHLLAYRWQTGSITSALHCARLLWPWLSRTKKQQFIKAVRESARDFRLRKAVKR